MSLKQLSFVLLFLIVIEGGEKGRMLVNGKEFIMPFDTNNWLHLCTHKYSLHDEKLLH